MKTKVARSKILEGGQETDEGTRVARADRIFAGRKTDRLISVSRACVRARHRDVGRPGEEEGKADTADDVVFARSGLIASNYFNELLATAPLAANKIFEIITG